MSTTFNLHEYVAELLFGDEVERRLTDRRGRGREAGMFEEMWLAANADRRSGERRSS